MLPTREVVFVSVPCVRVCEAVCASSASVRNIRLGSKNRKCVFRFLTRVKKRKTHFRFFDPSRIFLTLAELAHTASHTRTHGTDTNTTSRVGSIDQVARPGRDRSPGSIYALRALLDPERALLGPKRALLGPYLRRPRGPWDPGRPGAGSGPARRVFHGVVH